MRHGSVARDDGRLDAAFAREERQALRMVTRVRAAASVLIALYTLTGDQSAVQLYWAGLALLFGVLGLIQHVVIVHLPGGRGRWKPYLFAALDAAFLTVAIFYPNPFLPADVPAAVVARYPAYLYYFVLMGVVALTYTPKVVIWTGICCAVAYAAAMARIAAQPDSFTQFDLPGYEPLPTPENLEILLDPNYVALENVAQVAFVILLMALILAAGVWRARRLVRTQASAERARTNLARYFSPNMVDELAAYDAPFDAVRTQDVAVLFADIVGFTRMAENAPPERAIELLREFHGRMANAVFAHDGTVDKYIGDSIMATFGTPRGTGRDAANALACARAMLGSVAAWNAERAAGGEPPVRIGVGVHYGPVVLGDIGDERRLEFATIGDTVNVAARLEALTREAGVDLVVSDEVVATARAEGDGSAAADLVQADARPVRGRRGEVSYWTLGRAVA